MREKTTYYYLIQLILLPENSDENNTLLWNMNDYTWSWGPDLPYYYPGIKHIKISRTQVGVLA